MTCPTCPTCYWLPGAVARSKWLLMYLDTQTTVVNKYIIHNRFTKYPNKSLFFSDGKNTCDHRTKKAFSKMVFLFTPANIRFNAHTSMYFDTRSQMFQLTQVLWFRSFHERYATSAVQTFTGNYKFTDKGYRGTIAFSSAVNESAPTLTQCNPGVRPVWSRKTSNEHRDNRANFVVNARSCDMGAFKGG